MAAGGTKRRDAATALGLFVLAFAIRSLYIRLVAHQTSVMFPVVDARAYHDRALQILSGYWQNAVGYQAFYQDPLYPFFLAGLYALFGDGSIGVLLAQGALDSATVVLIFLLARQIFDYRTATLAGLLAAFYKLFFYYDALLLKVPLTLFLITLSLLLFVRAERRDTALGWFFGGLTLGLAMLTRGNYLLFTPVVALWIVQNRRESLPRASRAVALVGLGVALAIGPVSIRNYWVADDFVLISSQAGQNFYSAHHRGNRSGIYQPPGWVHTNPAHEERAFRAKAEQALGRPLKPSETSAYWFAEGWKEIQADPGHFAWHTFRKLALFFNHFEVPDNTSYYFFREHVTRLLKLPFPTYGALVPLAVCGMAWARRRRGASLLIAFFVSYLAGILIFFTSSRIRIPVAPVVIIFSAFAILELGHRIREQTWSRSIPACVFLLLAYPIVYQNLMTDDFMIQHYNLGRECIERAVAHRNLAQVAEGTGNLEAAWREREVATRIHREGTRELRRALEIAPEHAFLQRELANALTVRIGDLRAEGETQPALKLARELIGRAPNRVEGYLLLAELLEAQGDLEAAGRSFRRAQEYEPGNPRAQAGLQRIETRTAPPTP